MKCCLFVSQDLMVDQFSCTKVYTFSILFFDFLGIVPCDSLPWRICLTVLNHQTKPNKQIQTTLSPINTNPSYPQRVWPFIGVISCYFIPFITRLAPCTLRLALVEASRSSHQELLGQGTWRIIQWLGYVVNNHGDRKCPKDRIVGALTNCRSPWLINGGYLASGMILQAETSWCHLPCGEAISSPDAPWDGNIIIMWLVFHLIEVNNPYMEHLGTFIFEVFFLSYICS